MTRAPALALLLLTAGAFTLAPSALSAQESDRGDSGVLAAKSAGGSTDSGDSGAPGAKSVDEGPARGDFAPVSGAVMAGSSDDAPSWSGKSVEAGLSDNMPVAGKAMRSGSDGDSDAAGEGKVAPVLQGDDVRPDAAKGATAGGAGDDSGRSPSG